jgi:protoporphyrinogen/coproporphyrinogen III oxidase
MTVTILGGGIGGLSSAFYLAARNNIAKIRLYEASSRVSGWINSEKFDGYYFESSARTLRPKGITGNTTLELVHLLGLENKVVPITSDRVSGKFRLNWSRAQFHSITPEIDNDLRKLFSGEASDSESIYDYTARKFSKELADNVICPMVAGINAGDAKEISASFLVKGARSATFEPVDLYKKASSERWSFYSFEDGIETLPKAIFDCLSKNNQVSLNTDSMCKKIHFNDDGKVTITVNDEVHSTNHIISSLPGHRLAPLLQDQHPELAQELKAMRGADVAMVNLHFPSEDLLKQKGFGVFSSPSSESPVLGITFDSWCFNMRGTTLTVMLGGNYFEKFFGSQPEEQTLLDAAVKAVQEILSITEKPDNHQVNVMKGSFPQYTVGHYERLNRIKRYIESRNLPLSLCGQSYDGIGINEVILSAKTVANSIEV